MGAYCTSAFTGFETPFCLLSACITQTRPRNCHQFRYWRKASGVRAQTLHKSVRCTYLFCCKRVICRCRFRSHAAHLLGHPQLTNSASSAYLTCRLSVTFKVTTAGKTASFSASKCEATFDCTGNERGRFETGSGTLSAHPCRNRCTVSDRSDCFRPGFGFSTLTPPTHGKDWLVLNAA